MTLVTEPIQTASDLTGLRSLRDDELLGRFKQSNDREALAELIRRYVPMVYAAARRQVGDADVAEDVMQDVFVKFTKLAWRIRQGAAVGAWLLQTARYTSINALKIENRRRKREETVRRDRPEGVMNADAAESDRSDWEIIRRALDEAMMRLTQADQSAVVLRFFRGLTTKDVATVSGTSEEAARKRIARAISRLRKKLVAAGVPANLMAGIDVGALLGRRAVEAPPMHVTAHVVAASTAAAAAGNVVGGSIGQAIAATFGGAKVAAVVAAVMVIAAGSAALIKLMRGDRATQAPAPVAAVAAGGGNTAPAMPGANGWKRTFNSVYGLAPGQAINVIFPPFIPERAMMWHEIDPNDSNNPDGPDKFIFEQARDGELRNTASVSYGGPQLMRDAMQTVNELTELTGAWTWQVQGDKSLLAISLPGDVILRRGASRDDLMKGIADVASRRSGRKLTFNHSKVEHEVIVVTGIPRVHYGRGGRNSSVVVNVKTEHVQLPTTGNALFDAASAILAPTLPTVGNSTGPIGAMLNTLSNSTGNWFIDETVDGNRNSAHYVTRVAAAVDDGKSAEQILDDLLKSLNKQTGLSFQRENRTVDIWTLAEEFKK